MTFLEILVKNSFFLIWDVVNELSVSAWLGDSGDLKHFRDYLGQCDRS
mgnify:CR=1 FL=1